MTPTLTLIFNFSNNEQSVNQAVADAVKAIRLARHVYPDATVEVNSDDSGAAHHEALVEQLTGVKNARSLNTFTEIKIHIPRSIEQLAEQRAKDRGEAFSASDDRLNLMTVLANLVRHEIRQATSLAPAAGCPVPAVPPMLSAPPEIAPH